MRVNIRRKRIDAEDTFVLIEPNGRGTHTVWTEDGVRLGTIAKGTRTWERRTPGARYVNARGTVAAWTAEGSGVKHDTRKDAIHALIQRTFRDR